MSILFVYKRNEEKMQNLIVRGALEEESKLPSVRSLAVELAVNPNTIQRAYVDLEEAGYIYTVKGRGNFVAKKSEWQEDREHLIDEEAKSLARHAREAGIGKERLLSRVTAYYEEEKL
ncbi:MAG: GntR family transcriptional regulator [Lachnospiraceae bacterium]|nr:GntR family transcriptional regulator [Lachnospiraceae bacterium]